MRARAGWPGFVEFDEVNGKVLTFSSDVNVYKVWSLAEPLTVLYSFSDRTIPQGIHEIKISPGIMLIVCNTQDETRMPLHLLSVETGETLRTLDQPIRRARFRGASPPARPLPTLPAPALPVRTRRGRPRLRDARAQAGRRWTSSSSSTRS